MEGMVDTLAWLYSLEGRGEIYKLERMDQAMALIGDPHLKLRAVHIAGTKGKGSVAAMIDACLRAAGYRCGLYTKPHLVNLTERTRINGAEMPAEQMISYIGRLRAVYERAGLAPTFFEFTVALMFLYFAEAEIDLAVIETGLGGRLDSTNVVRPLLSVITPIGLDHMDRLGNTLSAIAAEKGGIIKPRTPVVIGARDPAARLTLTSMAAQRESPAFLIDREFSYRSHAPDHRFDYTGLGLSLSNVALNLAGPFQHENGAVALAALEGLRAQGMRIDEPAVRRGMAEGMPIFSNVRNSFGMRRSTIPMVCFCLKIATRKRTPSVNSMAKSAPPTVCSSCWQRSGVIDFIRAVVSSLSSTLVSRRRMRP